MANALRFLFIAGLFSYAILSHAMYRPISLKDHYPQKYVVQKGDTLYDIANAYLKQPWQWKQIWHDNPKIQNPNRIYPGAIITLEYPNGRPHLKLIRQGTYRLSPQARPRPAQKAIPPIHLSAISPFLSDSQVFDIDKLENSAYVVAINGEHLLAGQNVKVYVKNLEKLDKASSYAFYRPAGVYRNPSNKEEILGYIGRFLGTGELLRKDKISTLEVIRVQKGVRPKDRVLPNDSDQFSLYFEPQAPKYNVKGSVIDLIGGISQIATNQVIAVDLGKNKKIQPGDVLALWQKERVVVDPLNKQSTITLPKERLGEAMVFRVFSKVSYALIVNSIKAIHKGDTVSSP